MKIIKVKIKGGYVDTIVDDEDYKWAKNYTWILIGRGYAARQKYSHSIKGKSFYKKPYLHREIMNATTGQEIDHINGNKLDNRKENLRFCSRNNNMFNKHKQKSKNGKPTTSIYKGVRKAHPSTGMKTKQWIASITKNNKLYHIGYFKTEKDAALAYNMKANEFFKEFACLNIIK
jgi:hypothetical protein